MKQLILQHIQQFIKKFTRHLLISALLILYLIAFWLLFFTKGIYVNDHFYKKSANLTQITYTSRSPLADYKTITLQKQVDMACITIDDEHTINAYNGGKWVYSGPEQDISAFEDTDWASIATQKAEQNRGFGNKPWILALVCIAAALYARFNSTKLYEFFNKNKAANERYYKLVDTVTKVVVIALLVYLIIPL